MARRVTAPSGPSLTRFAMLNPTFLLAATINEDGCMDLPAVQEGSPFPRAHFWPGEDGAFLQRIVSNVPGDRTPPAEARPLDMVFFARCLWRALGALTPGLFTVVGYEEEGARRERLVYADARSEAARVALLRDAFLVHLQAYEEHLI